MLRRCLAVVALVSSLTDANCNSASSELWGPPKNAATWGKWHYCNRRPGDGNTRYSYMVRDDNMPPADVAPYVCKDANKVPRHDVDGLLCANYNLGDEYGGACSDRTCCTRGVCSEFDCPPNFTRRSGDLSCYFGCDVDTCCNPSPQFPVPKHHAAGMVFVDTDPGRFSFGGTATILRAVDESDITHYRVYWGFSLITRKVPSCGLKNPVSWNTEKYKHPDKLFREFPVTGCDITFEIPQGTKPNERCPINWDRKNRNTAGTDECNPHYFMVVSVNANGEKAVTRTNEQQVGPRHAIADYNTEPIINLPCAMDGVTMGHDLPGPNDVVLGEWNKVKSAAECAQLCRDYNNPTKGPCRWWTFSYPNGGRSSNSCWMETQSLQRTHYGVRVMGPAVCPTPDDAAPTGRERPRCNRWVRLQNTRPFDGEASANKRRWWDSDKGVNFVQKPQQPDKPLGPYETGEQCQAICDLDPLCIGYLYMKRWVDGLHKHCWMIRVDTKLRHYDTAWDMWMCARENMAPSLVNGFDFQSHPFGYATCKGVTPYFTGELQDTDCCAALCDSDATCNAFTFAHHGHGKKGRCELFKACPELETHDKVAGCAYESCFDGYGAATYKRTETRKVQFVDMYPHPKGGRGLIPVRQQINNGLMHGVKAVCVVLRGGTSTAAPTSAEQMLAEEPYLSNSFEGVVDHDAVAVDVTRDVDGGALDDGLQYYLHCGFVDAATYGLPVTQTRSILLDSPEGFRFQGPKGYCRVKDKCTRKEKKLKGKTMDECTSACRSMSTCQAIAYKMIEKECIIYEKSGCVYNRAVIYNEKFIYCFNRVSTPAAVLSSGKCDSTCSSDADTCAYKRDIGYYERNYYAPKRSISCCAEDECTPNPCGDGQTCVDPNTSPLSKLDFTCTCDSDTTTMATGAAADCPVDECQPNPCTGGQTCKDTDKSAPNNFVCTCTNGVTATGTSAACEKDECTPSPCGAGQTCTEGSLASNSLGDFTCTCDSDTSKKATGAAADCTVDECQPNPCTGGQTCKDTDKFAPNNFVCTCANGVTATGASAVCEQDECAASPSPCGAGQKCHDPDKASDKLENFLCTCDSDASLTKVAGPASCLTDECLAQPCGDVQMCVDPNLATASLDDFTCTCDNGVTATGAKASCEKDECAATPGPCGVGQECNDPVKAANKLNDFVCTCSNDATLASTGAPVPKCVDDECSANPCGMQQTCSDPTASAKSTGDFVCTCMVGGAMQTGGPAVCMMGDDDECAATPTPCGAQNCADPNQSSSSKNDFLCTCTTGRGTATGAPAVCKLDECDAGPCGAGQTCQDMNDSAASTKDYVCTCVAPQMGEATGESAACTTNECNVSPPLCGDQACVDPDTSTLGDYTCTCSNGAKASGAKATCEKDECAVTPAPCGAMQSCHDPDKSYLKQHDFVCTCDADGTVMRVDGPAICTEDECDAKPCGDGQTCQDPVQTLSSTQDYTCTCSNGVKATGAAATCEKDECAATPCGEGQTCRDPNTAASALHDYVCSCKTAGGGSKTGRPANCRLLGAPESQGGDDASTPWWPWLLGSALLVLLIGGLAAWFLVARSHSKGGLHVSEVFENEALYEMGPPTKAGAHPEVVSL